MRSYTVNFIRHRLNLLRVHWSAKHGPGIRKAHYQLPLIPANVLKNIASTKYPGSTKGTSQKGTD
jgi:hypothetical protein